jgi:SSS family solute:Na+ symporter/sodium/proline symporter
MILFAFLVMLGLFFAVGLASLRKSTGTREDYYLASQQVGPALAGISAVATNNSGYMFIGVIGFTHGHGLSAIWLMLGWILGDYLASLFIHRRLRAATARSTEASYAAVLAGWNGRVEMAVWKRLAALLSIVFLGAYAAAQITAGSKALHGVLGWDPAVGAVLVALIVLAYSAAGGIRASIWTDVAQSFVMLAAMSLLCAAAIAGRGGIGAAVAEMQAFPGFLDWTPPDLLLPGGVGIALFLGGWMFAGFSVVGQPHVMVRFMALDDSRHLRRARVWYYGYFTVFYALATGVGMLSRIYLPDLGAVDPELALPSMSLELLHPLLVGVVLAGIFAATMSTADSLVLSCSAALTHDLLSRRLEHPLLLKVATALVTLLALGIALLGSDSVFDLVILSWSTLACAFAPLLTLYALRRRPSERVAIAMLVVGVGVALGWRWLGWHDQVYEGLPGILAGLSFGWLASPRVQPAPPRPGLSESATQVSSLS